MDLKALFAEILDAVVRHNKRKADTDKPNYYLNQKKQLWYGMMNQVDDAQDEAQKSNPS